MSQVPIDTCLQCGKTREEVKDYYNSPCATASYGETVEGLDDWDRHHWRDWSNKTLLAIGIFPEYFAEYRREDYYALPYAACEHTKRGHAYPLKDDAEWGLSVNECLDCGHRREPTP